MMCPYCGEGMRKGCFRTHYDLKWSPEEDRKGLASFLPHPGTLIIDNPDAHYCAECKKIVLDVPEQRKGHF